MGICFGELNVIGLVLNKNNVIDLKSKDKAGVIRELVKRLARSGMIRQPDRNPPSPASFK